MWDPRRHVLFDKKGDFLQHVGTAVLLPPCTPKRYGPVTQPELSVLAPEGACFGVNRRM